MRALVRKVETPLWRSDVRFEIETSSESEAVVIAWADKHPVAYDVVSSSKSKAFGLGASTYIGWAQRGKEPAAVLARLAHLRASVMGFKVHPRCALKDFWTWRARFTLEHFRDRGFTGGFVQEHCVWADGKEYPRHCTYLDLTPATLEEVLDHFVAWCESSNRYEGRTRVTIDGREARSFPLPASSLPPGTEIVVVRTRARRKRKAGG